MMSTMMVSHQPTEGARISIPLAGIETDPQTNVGMQTVRDGGRWSMVIIDRAITFSSPAAPHQDTQSQLHPWRNC